jgi:hypothetical protein
MTDRYFKQKHIGFGSHPYVSDKETPSLTPDRPVIEIRMLP